MQQPPDASPVSAPAAQGCTTGRPGHGFRRGTFQYAQALGADTPTLMAQGQMRSLATLERHLDPLCYQGVARKRPRSAGK